MSENDATKLTHTEMLSQVQTVIGAGHETTANTLTWALYELAKHPEMQNKLRAEIYETKKNMLARGRREFTPGDFEGMEYLQTVMKETLRIHPVVYYGMRESTKDTVLPLSKPITTTTGEIIDQLPIPKGMALFTSIAGYNRYKDLFGEDSHIFNPDRWLREDIKDRQSFIGVGVGGLMTFGSGNRSCVGWRFAMLEFSTFLTELIQEFVFALPDNLGSIRREACMVMIPQVEGQKDGGARLPLLVSLAPGLEDY